MPLRNIRNRPVRSAAIAIEMENAIFDDDQDAQYEVARILKELAERIIRDGLSDAIGLFDQNGNRVGQMSVVR